jgi:hypothetical protein
MDDFLLFSDSKDAALQLRDRVACLLDLLGLGRNPKKGHWEPTRICEHLGLQIDSTTSTFRAPASKIHVIATLSRTMLQHYARDTHGGYLSGSSQCSPEKCSTCTSPFKQPASTSANYTTSSLRAHDGEGGCDSPTS